MTLFTMFDRSWTGLDEEGIKARCAKMVGQRVWQTVAEYYSNLDGEFSPLERWTKFLTAAVFGIGTIRLAEKQLNQNTPVWLYRFDWPTPIRNGVLQACHALEIPFVWNNLAQPGVVPFTSNSSQRQPIADRMHAAWIAFAHTGNPSVPALEWPAYDLESRTVMLFDNDTRPEADPNALEREVWEKSLNKNPLEGE